MRNEVDLKSLSESTRGWLLDLRMRDRSPRTIALYCDVVERITRFAAKADPSELTPNDLRGFFAHRLGSGISKTTVSLEGRAAAVFFKWAVKEGLVERDPMNNIEVSKGERPQRDLLTVADIQRLIDGAAEMAQGPLAQRRDPALIGMLADSGCRVGELVSMTVEGVDLFGRSAEVDGKTGLRRVAFGAQTARAVDRWLHVRGRYLHAAGTDALWVGDRGAMTEDGVRILLAKVSQRVLGRRVSPHALRHAWAHHLMAQDVPDRHIQFLGGWRSPTMLGYYAREGQQERALRGYASPLDRPRGRR